jgi:hypothetical protein
MREKDRMRGPDKKINLLIDPLSPALSLWEREMLN